LEHSNLRLAGELKLQRLSKGRNIDVLGLVAIRLRCHGFAMYMVKVKMEVRAGRFDLRSVIVELTRRIMATY